MNKIVKIAIGIGVLYATVFFVSRAWKKGQKREIIE